MLFELVVFVALLWWGISSSIASFRRSKVRTSADRVISGESSATEERINEHITWFLSTTNWLHGRTEQDRCRVERLREMRKEMVTPHD
ncbi:hypothetical protein ES703_15691 [subsurface metagenome]